MDHAVHEDYRKRNLSGLMFLANTIRLVRDYRFSTISTKVMMDRDRTRPKGAKMIAAILQNGWVEAGEEDLASYFNDTSLLNDRCARIWPRLVTGAPIGRSVGRSVTGVYHFMSRTVCRVSTVEW